MSVSRLDKPPAPKEDKRARNGSKPEDGQTDGVRDRAKWLDRSDPEVARPMILSGAEDMSDHMRTEMFEENVWTSIDNQRAFAEAKRRLEGEDGTREPIVVRTFEDVRLDDIQPATLIKGVMDRGTVCMLAGFAGTAKSFISIDMGCRVALGQYWMGHKCTKTRVLYIVAEGTAGWKKRARAWWKKHGEPDRIPMDVIERPVQFAQSDDLADIMDIIKNGQYGLVIIDTMARCSIGIEENAVKDMGGFLDRMYQLRDAFKKNGTTILLVHHTGYDKSRSRGSSAIAAALDDSYLVESEDPAECIVFKCPRRKDYAMGDDLLLKLEVVHLGLDSDGDPITSCILTSDDVVRPESDKDKIRAAMVGRGVITRKQIAEYADLGQARTSRAVKELLVDGDLIEVPIEGSRASGIQTAI